MFEEILKSLETRELDTPYGISTAYRSMKSIEACFTGGVCPTSLFEKLSPDLWAKELKESASSLTYCNLDMADPDVLVKSIRDGSDITAGAILEYDCILSSKSKDRDRDIIEQKGGLEIDVKMPLLWQHIQVQPIGKHVAVLSQDEQYTKCRFAIADTQLGRDAAILVRFGALRKSHGFRPSEFAPLEIVKGADGKDVVRGWHIKKAACMEGSLVSIPANPDTDVIATYAKEFDGIVTPFSRGLLKNEGVKAWAKSVFDARPTQVSPGYDINQRKQFADATLAACTCQAKGADMSKCKDCGKDMTDGKCKNKDCKSCKSAEVEPKGTGTNSTIEGLKCPRCKIGVLDSTGSCFDCGYVHGKGKCLADNLTAKSFEFSTKYYGSNNPYPAGSFEATQYLLRKSALAYLKSNGGEELGDYDYVDLIATFADSAVVCWSRNGKSKCWRIAYVTSDDGSPKWTGEPLEVEIQATIVEKMVADLTASQVADAVAKSTPAPLTLTELARKMAAGILTADGTGGEVKRAYEIVVNSHESLRQSFATNEVSELSK